MKASAYQLSLDPSCSFVDFVKIRYLIDLQVELLREEARIRAILVDIQDMLLPNMGALQKNIAHAKTLVHDITSS